MDIGVLPSYDDYWLSYQESDSMFVGGDGCGPLNYTRWDSVEVDDDKTCVRYYNGYWFKQLCSTKFAPLCQLSNCYQPQCQ